MFDEMSENSNDILHKTMKNTTKIHSDEKQLGIA